MAKKKSTTKSIYMRAPVAALLNANSNGVAQAEYTTSTTRNVSHNLRIYIHTYTITHTNTYQTHTLSIKNKEEKGKSTCICDHTERSDISSEHGFHQSLFQTPVISCSKLMLCSLFHHSIVAGTAMEAVIEFPIMTSFSGHRSPPHSTYLPSFLICIQRLNINQ